MATRPALRVARMCGWALLGLVAVSSLLGLLVDGVYRESEAAIARYRGADLASLALAVPLLAAALHWRGRAAALALIGALAFCAYNYAFYVFGLAFNAVFLLHVAIFAVAVFGTGFGLAALPLRAGAEPHRGVAALLVVLGGSLGVNWIVQAVLFALDGRTPEEALIVNTVADVHLAYVLDLALLVPSYLLAAVLLWRRHPAGAPLATVLLVAGVLQQFAYMAGLAFQAWADVPDAHSFDPLGLPIAAAYIVAAAVMVRRELPARVHRHHRNPLGAT